MQIQKAKNEQIIKEEKETQKALQGIKSQALESGQSIVLSIMENQSIQDQNMKYEELKRAGENQAKINEINNRYAEKEKQRSAETARIQYYLAAIKVMASATTFWEGLIEAGLVIIAGELAVQNILSTNVQQYAKGVKRVPGPSGVDKIPAMLTKDERVIDAPTNIENEGILDAVQDGYLKDYIQKNYVLPSVNKILIQDAMKRVETKEESKLSNLFNVSNSNNFSDYELRRKINETNRILNLIYKQNEEKERRRR